MRIRYAALTTILILALDFSSRACTCVPPKTVLEELRLYIQSINSGQSDPDAKILVRVRYGAATPNGIYMQRLETFFGNTNQDSFFVTSQSSCDVDLSNNTQVRGWERVHFLRRTMAYGGYRDSGDYLLPICSQSMMANADSVWGNGESMTLAAFADSVRMLVRSLAVPRDPAVSGFKLWPNPLREGQAIQIESTASGLLLLQVYDMLGRAVTAVQTGMVSPGQLSIPLPQLAPGLYMADIRQGAAVHRQLIKVEAR